MTNRNNMYNNNNPANMINQFMQFANQFKGGNPQQIVMEQLQRGNISQQQLNQLQQQATQIYGMLYGNKKR